MQGALSVDQADVGEIERTTWLECAPPLPSQGRVRRKRLIHAGMDLRLDPGDETGRRRAGRLRLEQIEGAPAGQGIGRQTEERPRDLVVVADDILQQGR